MAPVAAGCPLVANADSIDSSWPLRVAMEREPSTVVFGWPGFPAGRGERFVGRQVSETLIRIDCRGEAIPGLAVRWSADTSGRYWTLRLRPGARFSDGSPVTAADVTRSFAELAEPDAGAGAGTGGMLVGWAGLRAARRLADTAVVLEFAEPHSVIPPVLAHPALITIKGSVREPLGSGAFRTGGTAAGRARLFSPGGAIISYDDITGDPRSALDAGRDIVVTRDPRALAYAGGLEEYRSIALPWSSLYALVVVPGGVSIRVGDVRDIRLASIVRVSAREPSGTPWWRDSAGCPSVRASTAAVRVPPEPRVVFDETDPVARNLAERVVAVAGTAPAGRLTVRGLNPGEFRRSLVLGRDRGYVVALPRDPLAPCLAAGSLRRLAPWLDLRGAATGIQGLIETRAHAIVRPGRVIGRVEADRGGELIVLPYAGGAKLPGHGRMETEGTGKGGRR